MIETASPDVSPAARHPGEGPSPQTGGMDALGHRRDKRFGSIFRTANLQAKNEVANRSVVSPGNDQSVHVNRAPGLTGWKNAFSARAAQKGAADAAADTASTEDVRLGHLPRLRRGCD